MGFLWRGAPTCGRRPVRARDDDARRLRDELLVARVGRRVLVVRTRERGVLPRRRARRSDGREAAVDRRRSCVGLAGLTACRSSSSPRLFDGSFCDGDLKIKRENVERSAFGYGDHARGRGRRVRHLQPDALRNADRHGLLPPAVLDEPWFDRGTLRHHLHPSPSARDLLPSCRSSEARFPYARPEVLGTALVLTTPAFLYAIRAAIASPRNIAALVSLVLVSASC